MPADATETQPIIRRAIRTDAASLTELALRSKAVWGYDVAFMAACRTELTITPESIVRDPTFLIEHAGRALGFYQLRRHGHAAEIAQFFVAPERLRAGLGRRLWGHLERSALRLGSARLEVDSDPNAEGFYRAMGMVREGEVPSGSIAGRFLPRLAKNLSTR